MTLRLQLAATTAAVSLPLVLVLAWLGARAHQASDRDELVHDVLTRMLGEGREACERDPMGWDHHGPGPRGMHPDFPPPPPPGFGPGEEAPGPVPLPFEGPPPGEPPPGAPPPHRGPPRAVRLVAFDAEILPSDPREPALPPDVSSSIRKELGGREAGAFIRLPDHDGRLRVLVKMPWDSGPCSYIAAESPMPMAWHWLPPTVDWAAPLVAALLGLLVSSTPLVRRLQALGQFVRSGSGEGHPLLARKDELGDLARAFAEAQAEVRAQQAQQAQREAALREFLANTTHDLMIPLTALRGHLAQLESGLGSGAAQAELHAAADETHYISSLLTNLSVVARLESNALELRRDDIDLNALVARTVSRLSVAARQHQVELEHGVPAEPTPIRGDMTLLEQALGNLVANAVLYNRPGGHVAVVLAREAKSFHLEVIDDGPGIPPEERESVLQRGFRSDAARSRSPSGQGLGLAIAHEVARRHGWTLELGTSDFGGLLVTLTGPLQV